MIKYLTSNTAKIIGTICIIAAPLTGVAVNYAINKFNSKKSESGKEKK